ncbi:Hypothetical_protein [Hexamita inflata]|uniref:Hypothetical_protein n=1 Tax=Hexamita inflata TaxID=28002 RepID=A0AA86N823_9EUKA|nr:Hypothetical protein HINF_LOCUS2364 [Hexamita inflata]
MQRQLIKKDPVGQNSKQDMKNCSKQKYIPTTIFYNASHLKVDLFDISEHSSQPQQVFPVNNPAKKASPESSEQSSSPFIYWDQSNYIESFELVQNEHWKQTQIRVHNYYNCSEYRVRRYFLNRRRFILDVVKQNNILRFQNNSYIIVNFSTNNHQQLTDCGVLAKKRRNIRSKISLNLYIRYWKKHNSFD